MKKRQVKVFEDTFVIYFTLFFIKKQYFPHKYQTSHMNTYYCTEVVSREGVICKKTRVL